MREARIGARDGISGGRHAVAIRAPARPRRRGGRVAAPLALGLALLAVGSLAPRPAHAQLDGIRRWLGLDHAAEAFSGDLDGMVERRRIRILVVPSRTFYFVDRGTQRGLSYDLGQAFEKELNEKLGRGLLKVEVVYVPVRPDELLPALIQGKGDIAAANLTITPERQQWVDFSEPFWTGVSELVVTGPGSPPVNGLDDLSGKQVFVRLSSSYFQTQCRSLQTI